MIRRRLLGWRGILLASALTVAACGANSGSQTGGSGSATSDGATAGQSSSQTGKALDNFDPCSVVNDSDYVKAITAEAGDPSALGTVNATHAAVDGAKTGLPGAKACQLSYTTTDSAGTVNQGGDPVIVTFDAYNKLTELECISPTKVPDYQSSAAQAFECPGDAGVPYITKDGYLFHMSGNSDSTLLKTIALGIAMRL